MTAAKTAISNLRRKWLEFRYFLLLDTNADRVKRLVVLDKIFPEQPPFLEYRDFIRKYEKGRAFFTMIAMILVFLVIVACAAIAVAMLK